MSDVLEKFSVFSEISEQFKQNIKLLHVFDDRKGKNVFIVTNDDNVFAFGSNCWGHCGFEHEERVDTPQELPELNGKQIKQFFIGYYFVLALNENNYVFGWGQNYYGQLGRGFTSILFEKPAVIPDLENIIEISCGNNHSLALDEQRNVFSWGRNKEGQVGCGEESDERINRPVQLKELPKMKSIHCYDDRSFAVTFDGLVYSWGYNEWYCLEHKSRGEKIFKPELIRGLNNVISVASSLYNTYFLTNEGNIHVCGKIDSDSYSREYQFIPKILETDLKFQSIRTIYYLNDSFNSKVLALSEETVYYLEINSIQKTKYKSFFDYCLHENQITSETMLDPILTEYLRLGSGNFGIVYKWIDKNQQSFAIKILSYQAEKKSEYQREVQILSECDDNYVVKYYKSWIKKDQFYIQMELCDNNLKNIIQQKRQCFGRTQLEPMTTTDYFISSHLMKEILECVQYLHQMKPNPIIHRDLKPQNILVNYQPMNGRFLKLCDFGISAFESKNTIAHTRDVGTTKYMAPEVLGFEIKNELRVKYNTKADIYSLGQIFSELIDFDINSAYKNKLGNLIVKMINAEYNKRPDCKHLLNELLQINMTLQFETKKHKDFIKIKEFKNQFFFNYLKQKLEEYKKLDVIDEKRIEFIDKTSSDELTTESIEEMTFDSNDSSEDEINDTDNKETELEKQSFDEILEKMFPNFLKYIDDFKNVFIVTNDDKTFAFGSNDCGKCGFGHDKRVDTPQEIPELNGIQIKQFFIGGGFVLALNENNHVFSWGRNKSGQLGRGFISEYEKPDEIPDLENIIEISCGNNHSLALDEQRNVFSWGRNKEGQVGCGEESDERITRAVQLKELPKIKSIHCYDYRSFAVTFDGLVYSWGQNEWYCSGHKSRDIIYKPKLIKRLNNVISVGCSKSNTYFLTNEENILFCGEIDSDCDSREDQIIPKILKTDLKFHSLQAINSKVLALNEETVYCFERNSIQKIKYKTVFEYNLNERQSILEKLKLNLLKSFARYEEQCELGSGGFGTVIKAKDKLSGNVYALKIINEYNKEMEKEAQMLSKCNNKFVVKCSDYWIEENKLFLKMELCSDNLDNIIKEKNKCFKRQSTEEMTITEYFICSQLMKEILECVQYLHQMKPNPIIHRDLKPQNILVNCEPRKIRFLKLADFGLATIGSDLTMSHTRWKGTPKYTAPEVWSGEIGSSYKRVRYSTKVDVYSLGKILCELFGFDINSFEIKNNQLSHKWNELVKLTKNMLETEYKKRPSCKDILVSYHFWGIEKITEKDINSEKYQKSVKQLEEFENQFFINFFTEKQKSESVLNSVNNERKDKNESLKRSANEFEAENKKQKTGEKLNKLYFIV